MDTIMGLKKPARRYRRHSLEDKRRIVEETMQPGVSVACVARRHGMNDNMIFAWRKRFREENPRMLPVSVLPEAGDRTPALCSTDRFSANADGGSPIEIRMIAGHVIRIGAGADPAMVQAVLATLRR